MVRKQLNIIALSMALFLPLSAGNTITHSGLNAQGLATCDVTYFNQTLPELPNLNTAPTTTINKVEDILYQNIIICAQDEKSIFHNISNKDPQSYFMSMQLKTASALSYHNPTNRVFPENNVTYKIAMQAIKRAYIHDQKKQLKNNQVEKQLSYTQQIKKEKKKAEKLRQLKKFIQIKALAAELEHAHNERYKKEQEKKKQLEQEIKTLKKCKKHSKK